jgi:hypothetical protein
LEEADGDAEGEALGEGLVAMGEGVLWLVPEVTGPQAEIMTKPAKAATNCMHARFMPIPTVRIHREVTLGKCRSSVPPQGS